MAKIEIYGVSNEEATRKDKHDLGLKVARTWKDLADVFSFPVLSENDVSIIQSSRNVLPAGFTKSHIVAFIYGIPREVAFNPTLTEILISRISEVLKVYFPEVRTKKQFRCAVLSSAPILMPPESLEDLMKFIQSSEAP